MHIRGFMTACCIAAAAFAAAAQGAPSQMSVNAGIASSGTKVAPVAPLTAADLDRWLGGLVSAEIRRRDVAGAVIVVVKDGRVLCGNGYGYADVTARRSVDPETTLFRAASVSKLFTWTAVMQQVEQGRLDLDADINTYLDFKIPDTWPRPITLRNLMTHTSGFEEANKNTYAEDAASIPALGALLKSWVPERMYPPGEIVAYSNYGAALAGYIVERVSHERFESYIARHILAPLGMRHATFVQPVPPALAVDLSDGYMPGSNSPQAFELVELRPAGGLSVSGADMARFMMAQLDNGAFGANRILKPQSAIAMHGEAFRPNPGLPGMGLGFWHLDRNGHVVVAHTGDTVVFHSGLYLVLDTHTGLFVAENTAGDGENLPRDLFQAFMDRYYAQATAADPPTLRTALADGQAIAGTYENSRRADSSFMIAEEVFNERTIGLNPDATVSLSGSNDASGRPRRWREVGPFRWREVGGVHTLDAQLRNGVITSVITDVGPPISILMPASFWQSGAWNVPLFLATLGVLALTVLMWPVVALVRWLRPRSSAPGGGLKTAWRLTRVVALADLVFLCGWAGFLSYTDSHVQAMDSNADGLLRALQIIGALDAIGTLAPLYLFVSALGSREARLWTKASSAVVALACIATVWFGFSLHLLSWSVNY